MRRPLVIDILALAVFAVIARASHPPFTLSGLFDAFWPWAVGALAGWGIISIVSPHISGRWSQGLTVWLSTVIVGLGCWTLYNGRPPATAFMIVATLVSAAFLFGWRVIAAVRSGRRAHS